MKVRTDFSIFTSPTDAFGNAVGEIDVPEDIAVGDVVRFLPRAQRDPGREILPLEFRVDGIHSTMDRPREKSLSLEEMFVDGQEEAEKMMDYLEEVLGLVVFRYWK